MSVQRLLGINAGTGRTVVDYLLGPDCDFTEETKGLIAYEELVLAVNSAGVRAIDLSDGSKKWEFTCEQNAVESLYDYFQLGDSLVIFVHLPEPPRHKYEFIQLNCRTGKVLGRYGVDTILADKEFNALTAAGLGEWRGSRLILLETFADSGVSELSLCKFDPVSKLVGLVIPKLNDVDASRKALISKPRPLVLEGTVFYVLSGSASTDLIARKLSDGSVQAKFPIKESFFAGGNGKLFGLRFEKPNVTVICRDAANGDILWKKKLKEFGKVVFAEEVEMKVLDGRLYLLTRDYMRSLDATDGKIIWEVPLYLPGD